MKQKKQAHLPQERLGKRISPQKTLCYQQKARLDLYPKNLLKQRMKRIDAAKLKFSELKWREEPKEVSKSLIQALKCDKSIQKLFLCIPRSFTDQDYIQLAHSLKRFKSLKRITIDASFDNIRDEGLCALMKWLRGLCHLKGISFSLHRWDRISNAGLDYVSRTLKRMSLLEEIDFDFPDADEGVLMFNYGLKRLKNLKNMTFNARDCQDMTNDSLRNMSWKRLVALKNVYFNFAGCLELSDAGLKYLTQSFKKLENLQRVDLDFFDCPEFGNLGLRCIWEMMNSLPSLKGIKLIFSECLRITDDGFEDMNDILKGLESIQDIHFEFYRCSKITDYGLFDLCEALDKAVSLQSLYIGFAECAEVTDDGVKELIDCIKKRPHLQNIGLDFNSCSELTNVSLENIIDFLQSLTGPKNITLGFENLTGTTDNDFRQKIKRIQNQKSDIQIEFRPL